MRRKGTKGLLLILIIAAGSLGLTFNRGWKPLLGLDLQGGVMVVLRPVGNPDSGKLQTAIQIMDQRINSIGVAEPDIRLESGKIVVQIAGIKDKEHALKLVGETAELRFRPVLADLPPDPEPGAPPGTTPPGTTPPGSVPPGTDVSGSTLPGAALPGAAPASAPPTSQAAMGGASLGGSSGELSLGTQTTSTVGDVAPTPTPAPVPGAAGATPPTTGPSAAPSMSPEQLAQLGAGAAAPIAPTATTSLENDKADQVVVLAEYDGAGTKQVQRMRLGPALLTGEALEDASASLGQKAQWIVRPLFKTGSDGIEKFNSASAKCFAGDPTICPTKRLAITLDGRVITAPNIKAATFQRDQIEISGSFTEASAKEVATKLRFGALPVVLVKDQVQDVSATLGKDSLTAGLTAGAVGMALVMLYMVLFYRLLGALAVLKLGIEAALLWSIISYLGDNAGLALTLAGLTGIIVSIGVSLDSNVVFYEHLKEDVRNGRTYRSAVDKSFTGAFSTIVKADGVSVLGATLLYFLSVGPVRGFAFYLGLSTVLDLITSYYYMRPMVALAVKSELAIKHPGLFGLPRPEDVEKSTLAKVARRARARSGAPSFVADRDDASLEGGEVAP